MKITKRGKCKACCPNSTMEKPNYFDKILGAYVVRFRNIDIKLDEYYWECRNCSSLTPVRKKNKKDKQ